MTKIRIKTRLHEGIYRSQGGGQTVLVQEYGYGPRNLVRAYRELLRIRADNRRNYGNIGCGASWLETSDGRELVHDAGAGRAGPEPCRPGQGDRGRVDDARGVRRDGPRGGGRARPGGDDHEHARPR